MRWGDEILCKVDIFSSLVHGHPSGGGGGEERPQLRRPADPTMDEISKRMNKMEPYGNGMYSIRRS